MTTAANGANGTANGETTPRERAVQTAKPLTPAMTPTELLATMKDVLADERDAIRKLDAQAVVHTSNLKEEIVNRLTKATDAEKKTLKGPLVEMKDELRRNLVLLAHARAFVRDAIDMCGQTSRGRLNAKL